MKNVKKGKLGTCSIVYHQSKTIPYIHSQLVIPHYEGGGQEYYLGYGGCAYGFSGDYPSKKEIYKNSALFSITYFPYDQDLTLSKAITIVGKPESVDYDDFIPGLTYFYEAGPYVVSMNADDLYSPINYIDMYKPNY